MTGPAVDVEPTDADLAGAANVLGWHRGLTSYRALDGEAQRDIERVARALAAERAKHTDLIRRQDAALTAKQAVIDAVTELAGGLQTESSEWGESQEMWASRSDPLAQEHAARCAGRAMGAGIAAGWLRAALASPDTTQEDDRG